MEKTQDLVNELGREKLATRLLLQHKQDVEKELLSEKRENAKLVQKQQDVERKLQVEKQEKTLLLLKALCKHTDIVVASIAVDKRIHRKLFVVGIFGMISFIA